MNNRELAVRLRSGDYVAYVNGSMLQAAKLIKVDKEAGVAEVETKNGAIIEISLDNCFKSNADEFQSDSRPSSYLDDEEESAEGSNGKVKKRYAVEYKARSGNRDCDDSLAQQLRGADLDRVYVIGASMLEMSEQELRDKYSHLNKGMQRMSVGNLIRRKLKEEAQ